ncbi:hypothetical protein GWI24_21515 [Streptomyces sp. MK37H]|nr:hypothetical protein [Streptomyces sp. MK37H]
MEDFGFDHQRSVRREVIVHLGTLDSVVGKENVIFPGAPAPAGPASPPGSASGPASRAGHRVAFATAAQWVARLADAHQAGRTGPGGLGADRWQAGSRLSTQVNPACPRPGPGVGRRWRTAGRPRGPGCGPARVAHRQATAPPGRGADCSGAGAPAAQVAGADARRVSWSSA